MLSVADAILKTRWEFSLKSTTRNEIVNGIMEARSGGCLDRKSIFL